MGDSVASGETRSRMFFRAKEQNAESGFRRDDDGVYVEEKTKKKNREKPER